VSLTLSDVAPIIEFSQWSTEEVQADPSLLTCEFTRSEDGGWVAEDSVSPVAVLFFSPRFGELRRDAEAFIQ